MSVQDDGLVAGSDSFWEIDCYKTTVKRTEDGMGMCGELMKLLQERADIEKDYAKKLKSWTKKWADSFEKGSEYGTNKATLKGVLDEADQLADIHVSIRDKLMNEVYCEIKDWRNENYKKHIVGGCREAKVFEDEFKKAQKPWGKKLSKVMRCRKDYHAACKLEKSLLGQENGSNNNSEASGDQKKQQDKLDKCRKDIEVTKGKYEESLSELDKYTSKYVEDMKEVYDKTQAFERCRLEFFKQILLKLHSSLDISSNPASDANKDLKWWSQFKGVDMPMAWPVFEEYSPDSQATPSKTKVAYVSGNQTLSPAAAAVNNGTPSSARYNPSAPDQGDHSSENPFGDDEWDEYYNVPNDDDAGKDGVKVRALYNYVGQESDELSFTAVILGVVIIKLLSLLYNALRSRLQLDSCFNGQIVSGSDDNQYHGEQYTQRSALQNFEELPQPIFDQTDNLSIQPFYVNPPPYSQAELGAVATGGVEKPPTYDEAMAENQNHAFFISR